MRSRLADGSALRAAAAARLSQRSMARFGEELRHSPIACAGRARLRRMRARVTAAYAADGQVPRFALHVLTAQVRSAKQRRVRPFGLTMRPPRHRHPRVLRTTHANDTSEHPQPGNGERNRHAVYHPVALRSAGHPKRRSADRLPSTRASSETRKTYSNVISSRLVRNSPPGPDTSAW